MGKIVGLSLSHCIGDIAQGRIAYDDVDCIVSSVSVDLSDEKALDRILHAYQNTVGNWQEFKGKAEQFVRRLRLDHKIVQPGLQEGLIPDYPVTHDDNVAIPPALGGGFRQVQKPGGHSIAKGHWLDIETGRQFNVVNGQRQHAQGLDRGVEEILTWAKQDTHLSVPGR